MDGIHKSSLETAVINNEAKRLAKGDSKAEATFRKQLKESLIYHREEIYDWHTSASFASIYTKVSTLRKETFDKIDRIKRYYICDLILSQLVDDALTPEVGTHKVVGLTSKVPKIKKELDALTDRVDLNSLVSDIATDLFSYGEYYLSTVIKPKSEEKKAPIPIPGYTHGLFGEAVEAIKKHKLDEDIIIKKKFRFETDEASPFGLVNELDNVNQGQIVTLTYHGEVATYLVVNDLKSLEVREPADFIRFSLPGHRIRIDLHEEIEHLMANKKLMIGHSIDFPTLR